MMTSLLSYAALVQLLMTTAQQQQQQQKPSGQTQTTTVTIAIGDDVDCYERASCSYADAQRRNCYCDHACRVYDDCCADYDVTMTPASDVIGTSGLSTTVSCERLPDVTDDVTTRDVTTELYVVGRCPLSYNDTDVIGRCQLHASDNAADRFYRVPVVFRSDPLRLTYRNVYCAACNADLAVNAGPTFYVIQVTSIDLLIHTMGADFHGAMVASAPGRITPHRALPNAE